MTTLSLTPALGLALWREAAEQEVGVRIPCVQTDVDKIKVLMYAARKDHAELKEIGLYVAPGGEEIWLVKPPQEAP